MPSPAQLNRVRQLLNEQSAAAVRDFREFYDSLSRSDRVFMSRALADGWVAIVEHYGDLSAEIGAEQFDEWAAELGLRRPQVEVAPGVNEQRATARLGWALSTPDQLGNATVLLDELVKQPYRSTVQDSAIKSGAAWARVPTGTETCAFCMMLGSRGAVYHSKELAQFGTNGKSYHGHCDCTPTLVRGPEDYPKGYDPGALYDRYEAGRAQADSGNPKAILAAMREQSGTH